MKANLAAIALLLGSVQAAKPPAPPAPAPHGAPPAAPGAPPAPPGASNKQASSNCNASESALGFASSLLNLTLQADVVVGELKNFTTKKMTVADFDAIETQFSKFGPAALAAMTDLDKVKAGDECDASVILPAVKRFPSATTPFFSAIRSNKENFAQINVTDVVVEGVNTTYVAIEKMFTQLNTTIPCDKLVELTGSFKQQISQGIQTLLQLNATVLGAPGSLASCK